MRQSDPVDPPPSAGPLRFRWAQALTSPRVGLWLALVAATLAAPSLSAGWLVDDWFHRAALADLPGWPELHRGPLELFRFSGGAPADVLALKERGMLAWWAAPNFQLDFMRPLSAATHWLDHTLWPDTPVWMHAHSLVWLAVLVWVATGLYRRLLGDGLAAGCAALFYALDDARAVPAAWLANRNALIAGVFGLAAVWVHDRWRRDGWGPGRWWGPLLFALSLAAGESAVAAAGLLFAYALTLDPRPGWRAIPRTLTGYAVVGLAWLLLYEWGGYGAAGGGFYVNPLAHPVQFLGGMLQRVPILLEGQWGVGFLELAWVLPDLAVPVLWTQGLFLTGLLAVGAGRAGFRRPVDRFWLVALTCALVPASATMPSDRLLVFVGFCGFGWMSGLLVRPRAGRFPTSLAWMLLLAHALVAPALLVARSAALPDVGALVSRCADTAPDDDALRHQALVIINGSDACAGYLGLVRMSRGGAVPRAVQTLAGGYQDVLVQRIDAETLRVTPVAGWQALPIERLLRSAHTPTAQGDVVALSWMTATTRAVTPDGRLGQVDFRFPGGVDASDLRWAQWTKPGLVTWTPPPLGTSVVVPAALAFPIPSGLSGAAVPSGADPG